MVRPEPRLPQARRLWRNGACYLRRTSRRRRPTPKQAYGRPGMGGTSAWNVFPPQSFGRGEGRRGQLGHCRDQFLAAGFAEQEQPGEDRSEEQRVRDVGVGSRRQLAPAGCPVENLLNQGAFGGEERSGSTGRIGLFGREVGEEPRHRGIPICLAALLLAQRVMPDAKPASSSKLDLLGLALLSPGCAAIVYGLAEAGQHGGFDSRSVVIPLALGLLLLAGFAVHALPTRTEPIIDLRLFRARPFATSSTVVFVSGIAMFGAIILLPLYYQQVRAASALHAGLLLAPQGVGMALAPVIAGRLTDHIGPRPIVLTGLVLAAAGALVYTQVGPHTSQLLLAGALVASGAGMGAIIVPVMATPYRGLPAAAIPRATSAIRIIQQLGGAFGGAVLAVVLQRQIADRPATMDGLSGAFGSTFWWVLAFTAVAVLPALLLPATRARE